MMGSTGGQRNRIVWLLSAFHGRPFIDETCSIAFLDASCKLGAFVFQSGHPDNVIQNVIAVATNLPRRRQGDVLVLTSHPPGTEGPGVTSLRRWRGGAHPVASAAANLASSISRSSEGSSHLTR